MPALLINMLILGKVETYNFMSDGEFKSSSFLVGIIVFIPFICLTLY